MSHPIQLRRRARQRAQRRRAEREMDAACALVVPPPDRPSSPTVDWTP